VIHLPRINTSLKFCEQDTDEILEQRATVWQNAGESALYPGQIIQKIKNSTYDFGLGDLSIPLMPSNIQITKEKKSALLHLLDFTGEPS
jgi:hypothetical protein